MMRKIFIVYIAIILYSLINIGSIFAAIPQIEREALIALYNATDGDNWINNSGWKEPPLHTDGFAMPGTENGWYGINLYYDYYVKEIGLWDNQLKGNIPPEIGDFSNLKELILQGNQLVGGIPPEIAKLTNLEYLNLGVNPLTGNIPPELGNLSNLIDLYLVDCQLSGGIPFELSNLSSLVWLGLDANQLTGNIPPELGNLSNLKGLSLSANLIAGTIPPELGNLSNLSNLNLSENQLNGSIPSELGKLSNLEYLGLYRNQINGYIPPELGGLSNLLMINLFENQLIGTIPAQLGNASNLQRINIKNNQIKGPVPFEITNLTSLIDNGSDFCNNHLYTDDPIVRDFLNLKQNGGDWESCQIPLDNLTVTFPNGGQTLINGQEYHITWDSLDITGNIQIDLYKGGIDPVFMLKQLAAATEDDGDYLFTPTEEFVEGDDYYIGISAESGSVWDFSDSAFSIVSSSNAISIPELIYPNSENLVTKIDEVEFSWNAIQEEIDGEEIKYCIVVNEEGIIEPIFDGCTNNIFDTKYTLGSYRSCSTPIDLKSGVIYTWTAKAAKVVDGELIWGEYSEPNNFTTSGHPDPTEDLTDQDNDGIPDEWERHGVDFVRDVFGKILYPTVHDTLTPFLPVLNLPAMGADPEVPDIFVEIDCTFVEALHKDYEKFKKKVNTVIDRIRTDVANSFRNNPAGRINLHIYFDEPIDISNELPFILVNNGITDTYINFRDDHFTPEREGIFHYCLFTHSYNEPELYRTIIDDSGKARIGYAPPKSPGDFIAFFDPNDETKTIATFMHELGHTLGLAHGGPIKIATEEQWSLNNKPNYLSVMNYAFEAGLLVVSGTNPFNYSFNALLPLNEADLDEEVGLQIPGDLYNLFQPYYTKFTTDIDGTFSREIQPTTGAIQWRMDGYLENSVDVDINGNGTPDEILIGYNDWENLILYKGRIGNFGDSYGTYLYSAEPGHVEQTVEESENSEKLLAVGITADDLIEVCPNKSYEIAINIKNRGSLPDSYALTVETTIDPMNFNGLPSIIQLEPGQEDTLMLTVTVPDNFDQVNGETITINAISSANEYISQSIVLVLKPDHNVYGEFQQPINSDGSSIFKAGRTIPVKIILTDCAGISISKQSVLLSVKKITDIVLGTSEEIEIAASGDANTDNLFRYDPIEGQYIYNLSTKNMSSGTYQINATLMQNGGNYSVNLSLK